MRLNYKRKAATGEFAIAGAGEPELWTVNINTGATGAVLTLYDGVSTSGTVVAVIDASSKSSHTYGFRCPNGIYGNLTVGAADVSVGYH